MDGPAHPTDVAIARPLSDVASDPTQETNRSRRRCPGNRAAAESATRGGGRYGRRRARSGHRRRARVQGSSSCRRPSRDGRLCLLASGSRLAILADLASRNSRQSRLPAGRRIRRGCRRCAGPMARPFCAEGADVHMQFERWRGRHMVSPNSRSRATPRDVGSANTALSLCLPRRVWSGALLDRG
jgi:hypothetical protein